MLYHSGRTFLLMIAMFMILRPGQLGFVGHRFGFVGMFLGLRVRPKLVLPRPTVDVQCTCDEYNL